ncbi:MAG: N-acyl-D-amino-acid deacylase [Pseudomonadota bacterium]|jgi:N-acyl-D-amino-acid deacylase
MPDFDILFRNARIIDGSGGPSRFADLAVEGDRIAALGGLSGARARAEIDATGAVLAPGFIDSHAHDDLPLLLEPDLEAKVSQGVTTTVNGNCGFSLAPCPGERNRPPAPLGAFTGNGKHLFPRFIDYLQALDAAPGAVNSICLVGHTTLRHAVMEDFDRPATSAEIEAMCALLDQALSEGAAGLSTGLYYPPAQSAPTEEVIALARVAARHGAPYVTHMRDERDGVAESLVETFRIGREAGTPVIVSHHKCAGRNNHGRSHETLALIARAAERQEVGLDAYPYTAASTFLVPARAAATARVVITASRPHPECAGRELAEIAADWGCSALEAAERLVPGGAVYFDMDEEDVRRILAYPATMIGSDGIVMEAHPHPRAWGTFPRVLGRYARDEGLFSLETAVHKMTGLTAARFGLRDRGVLAEGAFADLCLFDPQTIRDEAGFAAPRTRSRGVLGVWVNGQATWSQEGPTGGRPGRALRLRVEGVAT